MTKKTKTKLILSAVLLYISAVYYYQAFKVPEMTKTQLLLELPNNLILRFK